MHFRVFLVCALKFGSDFVYILDTLIQKLTFSKEEILFFIKFTFISIFLVYIRQE